MAEQCDDDLDLQVVKYVEKVKGHFPEAYSWNANEHGDFCFVGIPCASRKLILFLLWRNGSCVCVYHA